MKKDLEGLISTACYITLYIFFVVSAAINNATLITIAFLLIAPFPFYTIIRFLFTNKKIDVFQKIEISVTLAYFVTFAFGIAFIPETEYKGYIIQITSAFIAGFMALVGVGWTIKYSRISKKEDEIKKHRPVFSFNMLREEPKVEKTVQKICMSSTDEKDVFGFEVFVELENSNLSPFEIKRILHDNNWIGVEGNKVVLPNTKCILNFRFSNYPENIYMEVEDLLKIKHYYHLFVLFIGSTTSSSKTMYTIREIEECKETDCCLAN